MEHLVPIAQDKRLFTIDDLERMEDLGIFQPDERVELLNGELFTRVNTHPRHDACVDRAAREFFTVAGDRAIVRVQGTIRLNLFNQPQPDLVLLRPRPDYYAKQPASPADILLVVEVALGSIHKDQRVKGPIYAKMGVAEYWLADLNRNVVLRHANPQAGAYRSVYIHQRGQSISPHLLADCDIPVDALLIE